MIENKLMRKITLSILLLIFSFTVLADADTERDPSHSANQVIPGLFTSLLDSSTWGLSGEGSYEFYETGLTISAGINSFLASQGIPFFAPVKFLKPVGFNDTLIVGVYGLTTPPLSPISKYFEVTSSKITSFVKFASRNKMYLGTGCEASSPTFSREGDAVVLDLGVSGGCSAGAECQTDSDCVSGICNTDTCS
jgi:hypothetical protein